MTRRLVVLGGVSGALAAQTKPAAAPAAKPAPSAAAAKPAPPAPGLYANIVTSMGTIRIRFYEKESPITVKNFVDLAMGRKAFTDPKTKQRVTRPFYNGLTFHRVIPNFMIQGGDPLGTGFGGVDPIPDEFNPMLNFDEPGRVAMASKGPGTASCQFFITETPQPHLNGNYNIFGRVVSGQALVTKIARVPVQGNKPLTPVTIVRVMVDRVGPDPNAPKPVPGAKPAAPAAKPVVKAAPKKQ